jgi:catechol 2,3-dioxygenase-like lactoylglutathione lyase family enzyme
MFEPVSAFSGFSVNDLAKAKEFYEDTLGLKIDEEMGLNLKLPGGGTVFVYEKPDHKPASYTALNFVVKDIDEAVEALTKKSVEFEKYDGMHQDEKGVARPPKPEYGPPIAWFKDPAGNILSVLQD